VQGISGEEGNFEVTLTQNPRYVNMDKCIACDACAEKCPKKVSNAYDGGLSKRKAVYVQYPQAVPLKYTIDADTCIYFLKGKCKACEKFCPTGAINFEDQGKEISLNVGAVVLASGSETFDPRTYDTFGYSKSANIVTSLEFERILSASGPYGGHLVRPSDKKEPEKIAWLQCVGSRDAHHGATSTFEPSAKTLNVIITRPKTIWAFVLSNRALPMSSPWAKTTSTSFATSMRPAILGMKNLISLCCQ
jgi:heterodisulfide reductase subunit A